MPLTYDLTKVKDFEDLKINWKRTETLIFATMFLGVREIDEKTAEEFWLRLHIWEFVFGQFFPGNPYTREDVERHIGLRTNATTETQSHFRNRLWKIYVRENSKKRSA